jgi:hypothetical protein
MDATPPTLPGLATRAANFAGAVVAHVAAGCPSAPPELAEARLAVCHGCDKIVSPDECGVCGCIVSIKAGWAEQACPLSRWPTHANPPMTNVAE